MGLSRNVLCPANMHLIGFLNYYGPGEPGGLPSLGSHRVGHDWSDLAVAVIAIYYPFPPVWMQVSTVCVIIIFGKWGTLTCPLVHRSLVPQKMYLQGCIQWTTSKELIWFEPDIDDEVLDFVPVLQWMRLIGMGWGVSVLCMWEGCQLLWSEGRLW